KRKDMVVGAHRLMAIGAFGGEARIPAIGFQSQPSYPTGKTPAVGRGIFVIITDHEFDLFKSARPDLSRTVRQLIPGYLGKGGAIGPGMRLSLPDGRYGNVIAHDDTHRPVVKTFG